VENGRLVGMLTLADVGRTEHRKDGLIETGGDYDLAEPVGEEQTDELDPAEVLTMKDDYSPEILGHPLVGDWMSRGVVSVSPVASLEEVCSVMVQHQIHRVCVTEEGRLVGLVTTFDVVRHVAGITGPREAAPARRRTRTRRPRAPDRGYATRTQRALVPQTQRGPAG
jgi:CBS domain-containing protein